MTQEDPRNIEVPGVKEIATGLFCQEVEVTSGKEGTVMAEMPNFGYMLWGRDGKRLTDDEVRQKIAGGAKVVGGLTGLDSDPTELNEIVKQFYEQYEGKEEVLFAGLAKPGSWRMQYDSDHKLQLVDVSVFKYVLMVLEWAKHMGLDGSNMVIMGHSAGGEAAVWLSKWFKIIGLNPALHPKDDPTFSWIERANVVASKVRTGANNLNEVEKIGNVAKLGADALRGGVGFVQKLSTATLTGSGFGTPFNLMHHTRMGDGGGVVHDYAVTELCYADLAPFFNPILENINVVGGQRDILTDPKKMYAWFKDWFDNGKLGIGWESAKKKITEWFPKAIARKLKHDTTLIDADSVKVIGGYLGKLMGEVGKQQIVEISDDDLAIIKQNIGVVELTMTETKVAKDAKEFLRARREFTLKDHRDMEMDRYLKLDIFDKISEYLERVNEIDSDVDYQEWLKTDEGSGMWRDLVVTMLGEAKNGDESLFSDEELDSIGKGEIQLKDPRVRAKVASFPLHCEREGWLTDDDLQTPEFRGRASRGDLLDTVIYILTDNVVRRGAGMEAADETEWELMAIPSHRQRLGGGLGDLKKWYKDWILNKRDYAISIPGIS